MEKVLLINPGQTFYPKSYRASSSGSIGLPLGLLYVASVLEAGGSKVEVLDCMVCEGSGPYKSAGNVGYGLPAQEVQRRVRAARPDIVGIGSQFAAQEDNAVSVADQVKEVDDSILVVLGGSNACSRGAHLMEVCKSIDVAVKGEGELTARALIDARRGAGRMDDVKGIVYRAGDGMRDTGEGLRVERLDDIPFPAYHLVDMEEYLTLSRRGVYSRGRDVDRSVSMITSRGCPYNCVFCSISGTMGRRWRAHSPEYVVRHIDLLHGRYGARHIHFEDDNLLLEPSRFIPIMGRLRETGITWDTPNGVRADSGLSVRLLAGMRESGCKSLTIGVESGDQRVLDEVVHKGLSLSDAEEFASRCRAAKLPLRAFYVLGLPGEDLKSMNRTVEYALRLLDDYDVEPVNFIATPVYGTELYRICSQKGYLSGEVTPRSLSESTVSDGRSLISTEEFSSGDVERLSRALTAKAYRRMLAKGLRNPALLARRVGNAHSLARIVRRTIDYDGTRYVRK